ncbi:MAG: 2,3,4,5-tetrahydropyridine-2-carboxylate N-succinyltransferase [Planctomycetota bacterium]|jgi:2,3,4,5-tetrahydropyridine-2-carboxylate N-succinyltransferase
MLDSPKVPRGVELLDALESGELRVAERADDGAWIVHTEVKEAILDIFRTSPVIPTGNELSSGDYTKLDLRSAPFRDKDLLRVRRFNKRDDVRMVPGGSAVRRGSYLGPGVVCMPPMYINIGAYVGARSMIDSHALVGSCAQIGEEVHVAAAAQIGGVLEPAGARPVIVEDGAFVGGNTGLYEGVLVRAGAVIAAGVILTGTTRVFDLVNEVELKGTRDAPLEIPTGAVVIPGTRPAKGTWAMANSLAVNCAIITKYRDERTTAATALEEALR